MFHYILLFSSALIAESAGEIEFNRDIRPVLSDRCFQCHGPDQKKRKANLHLGIESSAKSDRKGKFVILPGKPDQSELVRRISSDDPDERMPPAKSGHSLTNKEIDLLKEWVAQGAKWQMHWSMIKPERSPLPAVKGKEWPKNPIDYFVLKKIENIGLPPAGGASKETLIRRVSFDLTGLPPTPEEIGDFVADESAQAYEKVVDGLLRSQAFGERMAMDWLDVARYADTGGYSLDQPRQMWRWRDWVIESFNQNKPFDEFTIEQIAGDLVPNATLEQKIATGFNRNHPIQSEGGIIPEEYRVENVADRVDVTSTVWMGLTMKCARCHDHKYDPVTQLDYYRFFAFFNNVPESGNGNGNAAPVINAPTRLDLKKIEELNQDIAETEALVSELRPGMEAKAIEWEKELKTSATKWEILDLIDPSSSGGSTLTKLEDHSILASGTNPAKDIYEVTARTNRTGIQSIRLEVLTDKSLPKNGPGRSSNANLVLTEFETEIAPAKQGEEIPKFEMVKFSSATVDHYQKDGDFRIEKTIDGNFGPSNGWAPEGYNRHEDRTAIYLASKPFGHKDGSLLRIRLRHESQFGQHAVGRFRLSISTSKSADLEDEVSRLVSIPEEKRTPEQKDRLFSLFLKKFSPEAEPLLKKIESLKKHKADLENTKATTMVMSEGPGPAEAFVLNRGRYDQRGDRVMPGVPAILPQPDAASKNRLDLARWLVNPQHPLTARVAVNRFWQMYFGFGLVRTAEDFGSQGEWPTHPELLDWLAVEFMRGGWDIKAMQKLIVMSSTYQQSSYATPEQWNRDPDNRLLARGPRFRLPAEMIRDQALRVSGLLVETVGGPSVKPYHPPGLWKEVDYGRRQVYQQDSGENLYRRSMYTFWKRSVPPPALQTFDAPSREACTIRRSRTNTPLQALILMNDPIYVEAARFLAQKVVMEQGKPGQQVSKLFNLVLGRNPNSQEASVLLERLKDFQNDFTEDVPAAEQLLKVGDSPRDTQLNSQEHAAWTAMASIVLNLDETITKR
ncbi:MAG: PSD1 and planctomycete cytochrome C domain-containing protein [Planctomycetota bacterium]|nr:PSD1 and planctomycete cytochrome C domain-containing protein [Planctomycetota bacterium]MDA1141802.1 PSD1 and planctomycete cytochrome C domain-containing protein [Planctomycetota bacterium]